MPGPIIGNLKEECSWCGTWYGAGSRVCPNCKRINPDYQERSERFHNTPPHGTEKAKVEREKVYEDD